MKLQYKFKKSSSKKLIIYYQNNLDSNSYLENTVDNSQENFAYSTILEKLNVNILYVRDCTNQQMGWFQYQADLDITDQYLNQLEQFVTKNKYSFDNTFLLGFGKGGYGVIHHLLHSSKFVHGIAIAPHLSISEGIEKLYYPGVKTSVLQSFAGISESTLSKVLGNEDKLVNKQLIIFDNKPNQIYTNLFEIFNNTSYYYQLIVSNIDLGTDFEGPILSQVIGDIGTIIEDWTAKLKYGPYQNCININESEFTPVSSVPANTLSVKSQRNVGIICDSDYYYRYMDSANLVYITYDNIEMKISTIDYLLFITPWRGIYNEVFTNGKRVYLQGLLETCKRINPELPIVFVSKEDPPNFQLFKDFARNCDLIYTSSESKKIDYQGLSAKQNVYTYNYGINPYLHNPVDKWNGSSTVHFAGSFITDKYPERSRDLQNILNQVIETDHKLVFRNRNLQQNMQIRAQKFQAPNELKPYEKPGLNYLELLQEQGQYTCHVNINSVKYDQSMSAVRPYELQAMGKEIISNYSIALSNQFPSIHFISFENEYANIHNLSKYQRDEHRLAGLRNVYSNYLASNLISDIEQKLFGESLKFDYKLYVIATEKEPFINQTFTNFSVISDISKVENNGLVFVTEYNQKLNYKPTYLEDMINGFKYTNATRIQGGLPNQFTYTDDVQIDSLSMWVYNQPQVIFNIQQQVQIIPQKSEDKDKIISVIIPVYNNGHFLKYRALSSLKKSKLFKQMEIIIVDDGSEDETINIINEQVMIYSNMQKYLFNDGGSGSASRGRNKGLELATCEYIAYIDPDNEFFADGIDHLFELIKANDVDFVQGRHTIHSDEEVILRKNCLDKPIIVNGIDKLIYDNFNTPSMQAGLFKRKFLQDNNIQMPIGAIGQDSLFYYQVMVVSNQVMFTNHLVHKYYGRRDGSVVNSITLKTLSGQLQIEQEKYRLFANYNLTNYYRLTRLTSYFQKIINKRFECISPEQAEQAFELYKQIVNIYGVENIDDEHTKLLYSAQDTDKFYKQLVNVEQLRIENKYLNSEVKRVNKEIRYVKENMRIKSRLKRLLKR